MDFSTRFFVLLATLTVVSQVSLAASRFPDWDDLSVTWGKFSGLPRNVDDAVEEGWVLETKCQESTHFRGNRYVQNNDSMLMLLFDSNKQIAGVQFAVPKESKIPKNRIPPYVEENGLMFLTAYFIDPNTICNAPARDPDFIGDNLLIQVGNTFTSTMKIPLREKDLAGTKWVAGKCFYTMGNHYWYDISTDMDCNDFFPVFLLYNGDVLNGFGWLTLDKTLKSKRVEQPTSDKFSYFFKKEAHPKCINGLGKITSQHVFLQRRPYFNFC